MQFALDKVGQWSDEQDFKVEAERIKQYAAATNDPIPGHANGELAPPVFSVVPVWDAMGGAVGEVTPAEAFPTCTSTSRSFPARSCGHGRRRSAST